MDQEFHYWVMGILASEAGFSPEDARTIAYASQYVDDNQVEFTVMDKQGSQEPYHSYVSQTMDITKPQLRRLQIYPYFHFIPGDPACDSACRRDGNMHLLNTTPDNERANNMMAQAFNSPEAARLYRIGIAAHAYADTWAHQNFAGFQASFNGQKLNPLPNIGHADYMHQPDQVGLVWEDARLVRKRVDNNQRFTQAALRVYEHLCSYTGKEPDRDHLLGELKAAFGASAESKSGPVSQEQRLEIYQSMPPWNQLAAEQNQYDKDAWFKQAVQVEVKGFKDLKGIMSWVPNIMRDKYSWQPDQDHTLTHWYRFQEAVKGHQRYFELEMEPLLGKMGINYEMLNKGIEHVMMEDGA